MNDNDIETDEIWKRNEPDSPCKKICVVHPEARICIGCFRTIDEIRNWAAMPREERLSKMAELPSRETLLKKKRRVGRRRPA